MKKLFVKISTVLSSIAANVKEIHSAEDGKWSSKRVYGAIGFISVIVFVAIWQHDLISELMFTSAALLGLGILDRWSKNNQPPVA